MCNSRNNCSTSCAKPSTCSRNGERILVNQSGCSSSGRRRCSCANTYRPGSGCNHQSCGCGSSNCECKRPCPPRPCPPKPCPPRPRPCPPRPRPCCEDRCRAQYRQCMRNCRLREDNENRERYDYDDDYGYEARESHEEYHDDDYDYQRDYED